MNRRSFLRQAAAAITAVAIPVKLAATAAKSTAPTLPGRLVGNEVVATIGPGGDYATFAAWDAAWDRYCGKNLMAAKVSATAVILPNAPDETKYVYYWTSTPEHHVTVKGTIQDHRGWYRHNTLLRF